MLKNASTLFDAIFAIELYTVAQTLSLVFREYSDPSLGAYDVDLRWMRENFYVCRYIVHVSIGLG